MLLKTLTLENYRVYSGTHVFQLTPRERHGKQRPVILFGGMNGTGKTSILSAVKLALYGKASLGANVTKKRYEQFLADSIHRSRGSAPAPSASVQLTFSYSKLGVSINYEIKRSWSLTKTAVNENLTVLENGSPLKALDYDQTQGFLDELIPIGVSELFFFDGEKISELAEETGGTSLEHSLKKLLGLDLVERLAGDLTVLNRNSTKLSLNRDSIDRIHGLESALNSHRSSIEQIRTELKAIREKEIALNQRIALARRAVTDRGGLFAQTRQSLEQSQARLSDEKHHVERDIFELLQGPAPLALAGEHSKTTVARIEKDVAAASNRAIEEAVEAYMIEVAATLANELEASTFDRLKVLLPQRAKLPHIADPVHDLTPTQAGAIQSSIRSANSDAKSLSTSLVKLQRIEDEIDEVEIALARAPDDMLIKADFEELETLQRELGALYATDSSLQDQGRMLAQKALETARQLDKLYAEVSREGEQDRLIDYSERSLAFIDDFVQVTTMNKIADLEALFSQCFARLARKNDLHLNLKVDPESFALSLIDENGREIDKGQLSAGERQIFAISVLEALAKSSGRSLPMIIDTPLGRLDSMHRSKLIQNYFPNASHQMVILSTDTEVDEAFYKELSPEIARAYRLEYDPKTGTTSAVEGYFWRENTRIA